MTPDAPPPADVQRPEPLTEEELAVKLTEWNRRPHLLDHAPAAADEPLATKALSAAQDRLRLMLHAPQPGPNDAALVLALVDQAIEATSRLIADLRASRAQLAEARQDTREDYARAEQLQQELDRLRGTELGNRRPVDCAETLAFYAGSDDPMRGP